MKRKKLKLQLIKQKFMLKEINLEKLILFMKRYRWTPKKVTKLQEKILNTHTCNIKKLRKQIPLQVDDKPRSGPSGQQNRQR